MVWYGVKWKIPNCSEASIPPSVHFSINPFLQIILTLSLYCGRILINSFPQTVVTTFALASVNIHPFSLQTVFTYDIQFSKFSFSMKKYVQVNYSEQGVMECVVRPPIDKNKLA